MKKVIIFGSGLLGESMIRNSPKNCEIIPATRRDRDSDSGLYCNIADPNSVYRIFNEVPDPDAVVNCIAMSGVDACEERPGEARAVNALGVKYLAECCRTSGARLIHVSTDYVFNGQTDALLHEEDAVAPCSIYGATKAEGEHYALGLTDNSCVIRTAWLFGHARQDFVSSVTDKLEAGEPVSVIYRQVGTPTYTDDLSAAIWKLIFSPSTGNSRIYHFANKGTVTRYEMVHKMKEIMNSSSSVSKAEESSIPSWIAMRPKYSVMSCSLIEEDLKITIRPWELAFMDYLRKRAGIE